VRVRGQQSRPGTLTTNGAATQAVYGGGPTGLRTDGGWLFLLNPGTALHMRGWINLNSQRPPTPFPDLHDPTYLSAAVLGEEERYEWIARARLPPRV